MPRSLDVYSLPAGTTAVSGTTIESAKYNAFTADLVTDLNAARPIVAGGTGATTAAVARANLSVNDRLDYYATVGGTADAITLTGGTNTNTSYATGLRVRFLAVSDNTTAATINVDGLGVKAIKLNDGASSALAGGEIQSGSTIELVYDGTNFLLVGTVTTERIVDNAVTLDKLDHGTQGDILYYGASGAPSRLAAGTSGQALVTAGAGANPAWGSINTLTLGTPVSASSTSVDFTGIPSWAKRVTIVIASLSSNGTSNFQVQIGSGSFTTSGYTSQASASGSGTGVITSGFILTLSTGAANSFSGSAILTHIGSNQWVSSSILAFVNVGSACQVGGGNSGTLGGALDRVRITTIGGTDTFDAGTINIMYD